MVEVITFLSPEYYKHEPPPFRFPASSLMQREGRLWMLRRLLALTACDSWTRPLQVMILKHTVTESLVQLNATVLNLYDKIELLYSSLHTQSTDVSVYYI